MTNVSIAASAPNDLRSASDISWGKARALGLATGDAEAAWNRTENRMANKEESKNFMTNPRGGRKHILVGWVSCEGKVWVL